MFRCRDLLNLPTMAKSKLIAGGKGIDNGIRWSYKAESMNFARWVHGQELLIISTPVINSEKFDLYELVKEAIRLDMSGILLLVGEEYVSTISRKILSLANKKSMPIICLPGNVPLVDIFEELGHAIVYHDGGMVKNEDILAGIIFGNVIDKNTLRGQARMLGYNMDGGQRIFMINLDASMPVGEICEYACKLLRDKFQKNAVLLSKFKNNLIGITGEASAEKLNDIFKAFIEELENEFHEIKIKIGIGCAISDLTRLQEGFKQATICIEHGDKLQWYDRLGFAKVILEMDKVEVLDTFVQQVLGKIIAHDNENDSQLLITLRTYFECNESMKEAAKVMYIHPNTIKYRLQKIQELSGYNLSNSKERLELYNATLIWRLI